MKTTMKLSFFSSLVVFSVACGSSTELHYQYDDATFWVGAPAVNEPLVELNDVSYRVDPPLPDGLSLDTKTGVIRGTPKNPMPTNKYRVFVRNGDKEELRELRVTVSGPDLVYAPGALDFVKGSNLTSGAAIDRNGGKYFCTPSQGTEFPVGLSFTPQAGRCELAGTARDLSDARDYQVDVHYSSGVATAVIRVEVNDGKVHASPQSIKTYLPMTKSFQFKATGGRPPYQYKVTSGPGTIDDDGLYKTTAPGQTVVELKDATNQRDSIFINNVSRRVNGYVTATTKAPGAIFVAGNFDRANYYDAPQMIVVNKKTGEPQLGFYLPELDGTIAAIASTGTSLYIGGDFRAYGNNLAQYLVRVDAVTGLPDPNFTQFGGFDGSVSSLVISGNSLLVGGYFSSYRGIPARGLAKIDTTSGLLDTNFTQSLGFDGGVSALAIDGTSLFVGGNFKQYRSGSAQGIAKIDLGTGELDQKFSQSTGFDGNAYSLIVANHALYAAGKFTSYRGLAARWLAKLDPSTGALDTQFTQATGFDKAPRKIVAVGNALYAGGGFTSYRSAPASYLAKLDLTTGVLDSNFIQGGGFDGEIYNLAVDDNALYVGGGFMTYRGKPTFFFAKLDLKNGGVVDPAFNQEAGFDGAVTSMFAGTDMLFINGVFSTYRGQVVNGIAKFDATGEVLDEKFSSAVQQFGDGISTMVASGNALYVGGCFATYGSLPAQRLAKIDINSGGLDTTFTGATGFDGCVSTFALSGNSLYVGGDFNGYRGTAGAAQRLAKLDAQTGALDTTFTKASNGLDAAPFTMTIAGESLFVGGNFSKYRGVSAPKLVKLDMNSGINDAVFSQTTGFNNYVQKVVAYNDSLFVGGAFTQYRGASVPYFAKINLSDGGLNTEFIQSPGFNNRVYSLEIFKNALFVSGAFNSYNDASAGVVKITPDFGKPYPEFEMSNLPQSYIINALDDGSLLLSVEFSGCAGADSPYLCKIDATTGKPR